MTALVTTLIANVVLAFCLLPFVVKKVTEFKEAEAQVAEYLNENGIEGFQYVSSALCLTTKELSLRSRGRYRYSFESLYGEFSFIIKITSAPVVYCFWEESVAVLFWKRHWLFPDIIRFYHVDKDTEQIREMHCAGKFLEKLSDKSRREIFIHGSQLLKSL